MSYSSHPRGNEALAPREHKVEPNLAVEALRIAAHALHPGLHETRREQTLDVIQSRLTAILQSVGDQLDAVESIRVHLSMFDPNDGERVDRTALLPEHWRSRGPQPRLFSARGNHPLRSS